VAERDFEEKAEELREVRDIYREEEAEEAGAEAIGIVPGAPGARPARGRRIEDEVREQQNLLRGLKAEVQELKSIVPELKKSLVETSEAFEDFHKSFSRMGEGLKEEFRKVTVNLRKEFEKLLDQVGVLAEEFGYVVREFGVGMKRYSEGVRKSYRDLSEVLGRQRRRLEGYDREYERTIRDIRARARRRILERREREVGRRGEREFRLPAPVMQEIPRRGIGEVLRRGVGGLFGVGGGRGYGRGRYRYGGGIGEEIGDILFASVLGPLGIYAREWLGGVYERWQEARERRRGREWGLLTGGFVPDVVGVGEELFGFRRRRVDKFTLKDVELVQERQAKIYAEKLYVETKEIAGAGGGGLLGELLGRFGRVGRWIGRRAGWIGLGLGAGLAFLSGVREEGVGRGLARAGGTLAGGLGGAKLGAIIGTAIAPGIGTAIGTALGGLVGMLGGEKIADAIYSGMKRLIKDRDWVGSLEKAFTGAVDKIGEFLKGIIEGVKAGVESVGRGAEKAVRGVGKVAEWIRENIGRLDLGAIARVFEAGEAQAAELTKAAQVVSQTAGDIGGMSAGMYQFTEEAQLKFLRQYGFMKEFEGVRFGTPEWKRRWQEVARKYGERFARAQQEFAIREYFAPGAAVAERFGIDVRRSRALQEMIFARAVQHGVGGFEGVLRNVFRGMTPEQVRALSPEEVVTRVYDHLIANVNRYWARSSPKVRESVRKRLIKEKELLLVIEKQKKEVQGQEKVQRQVTREAKKQEVIQKQVTGQAMNLYEGMSMQNQVISGRSILSELLKQERWHGLITREVRGLYEGVKEQRGMILGAVQEVPLTMYEYAPEQWAVPKAGVVDVDVEREQEEMQRRLIDVDVRREIEMISGLGDVLEKALASVIERGGGGVRKVIMPGGEAFSKVPLFPEDLGLVMMMLGLV
jgi:hypothetical protein